MKVLLVGPLPPPHGGVSVHVAALWRQLEAAGVTCRVLDLVRGAAPRPGVVCRRGALHLGLVLLRHVLARWTLHLHVCGHNRRSWVVALLGGLGARLGVGGVLTVHSGMAPAYLSQGGAWRRRLARLACAGYRRVVCVNASIAAALAHAGVAPARLVVLPAFVSAPFTPAALPPNLAAWLTAHRPVLSTTLLFRPEYGFELLLEAVARLRSTYPRLGCLVMGGGEQEVAASAQVHWRGLHRAMLLLGDVAHDLCLTLIASSDAFVRTSRADGDAVSVREALAIGVPVVASDVGARPPGAVRFRVGDLDDLVEKLSATLADASYPAAAPSLPALQPVGIHHWLRLYEDAARSPAVAGGSGARSSQRSAVSLQLSAAEKKQ